ncbi:MAG TPA: MBL fold metallo-hydrolase [Anaerolineaceae bacterium]|nr:MBL fold metallo-hydrolase [Anaerolineaceae bacterium]
MSPVLSPSPHFQLHQLADGVYAALALDSGAAVSNAGIVDLGDRTLVYDTFLTPKAATDLRLAAETLTGRVISYVINSHWHNDHIRGNQVFSPETEILCTRTTRRLMETEGIAELQDDSENALSQMKAMEARLPLETDPSAVEETSRWVTYFRALAESTPKMKLRMPTWCFEGRLFFHGSVRSAELIEIGPGHTQNDSVLFLPEEKTAFVGDLVFVRSHPYLAASSLDEWLKALDKIEELDAAVIVPGHGPIGGPQDIGWMRRYILDLQVQAARIAASKNPEEKLKDPPIPEAYAGWKLARFYGANLRALVQNPTPTNGSAS